MDEAFVREAGMAPKRASGVQEELKDSQFNRNLPCPSFVTSKAMHWSRAIPLALLALVSYSHALHFYIESEQKRCFVEELPTDTVVEGQLPSVFIMHFSTIGVSFYNARSL